MSAKKRKKTAKKISKKMARSTEKLIHHYKKIRKIYEQELDYSAMRPDGPHAMTDGEIGLAKSSLADAKEKIKLLEASLRGFAQ